MVTRRLRLASSSAAVAPARPAPMMMTSCIDPPDDRPAACPRRYGRINAGIVAGPNRVPADFAPQEVMNPAACLPVTDKLILWWARGISDAAQALRQGSA